MTVTIAEEHDVLIDRLRLAQEIVERSQVRAELRPAAFAEIVRALDGRSAQDDRHHADPEARRPVLDRGSLSDRLAAVAEAFGIDASVVNQVFADDDDMLKLVVAPRRLTSTTRGAMRQIAILTVCARQAGGWDGSWTSPADVRTECERLGVYSKNFGAVLDAFDMFTGQGSSSSRQLRAHNNSFKAARDVLIELGVLGGSDA